MKTQVKICRQNADSSLTVLATKNLTTELDESELEFGVYARFQGVRYPVRGNCLFQYIVLGREHLNLIRYGDSAAQLRLEI